jgi:hypothetical protein
MGSWDTIKANIEIVLVDTPSCLLPTPDDLDRFETSAGFLLPLDYRDFVMTFGLGSFGPDGYEVGVPGYEHAGRLSSPSAMTEFVRSSGGFDRRSDDDLAEEFDDPRRARRLVIFCGTSSNDFWGWDPEDVTDRAACEYGIYQLGRYDTRVLRLATTFRDFVMDFVFEGVINPDGSPTGELPAFPDEYHPTRFFVHGSNKK